MRLESYLSRLELNLSTVKADLPALDETLVSYSQNAGLREKILGFAQSDAISRFYAAVLLWSIDKEKSDEILTELQDDETPLTIQKSIGHGAVEMPLYLLVRDFRSQESFPSESLRQSETLANWKISIATEKRRIGEDFDENTLPRYEDVLEAQTDAEKMQSLRLKIEKLKSGSAAERFYAAALVRLLDESEARDILETLLTEPAEVEILSGDTMMSFPASQIAAGLLGRNVASQPENQNPVTRFFKWLGG